MAFRNYVHKNSAKEILFMIKATQSVNRDVGSPSAYEQNEVTSKALVVVKKEKIVVEGEDVVDVEGYQEGEATMAVVEETGIGKRVSGCRAAGGSSTKRKAPDGKSAAPKKSKGSTLPPLPCAGGSEGTSEGSGDNISKKYDYGIYSNTLTPAHCHRLMATVAPKGWLKGLDRLSMSKLTDLQS